MQVMNDYYIKVQPNSEDSRMINEVFQMVEFIYHRLHNTGSSVMYGLDDSQCQYTQKDLVTMMNFLQDLQQGCLFQTDSVEVK